MKYFAISSDVFGALSLNIFAPRAEDSLSEHSTKYRPATHHLQQVAHHTSPFSPIHTGGKLRTHSWKSAEWKNDLTKHCATGKDCVCTEWWVFAFAPVHGCVVGVSNADLNAHVCTAKLEQWAIMICIHGHVTTSHHYHLTGMITIISHNIFSSLLLRNWLPFQHTRRVNLQFKVRKKWFHHISIVAHYHNVTKKEAKYKVC